MNELSNPLKCLPGLAWRTKSDGFTDYANPGLISYVGDLFEQFRVSWRSCVHPEDLSNVDEAVSADDGMDERIYQPVRLRRNDGTYRWFEIGARDSRDEMGRFLFRYSVGWDIHDSVLATSEFRRREVAIATLVDCIPGFIWQLSSTGELFYLNDKVSAYTGKTLEQLREPGWRDSVHPEDVDSFVAEWTRAMQGRRRIVVEFRLRRFDGAFRWFRTTGEPVLDSQSDVLSWCGVDIDIDEEKRIEQSLRITKAQLARTAQLAMAAELTASTANAINQPLAAIVANSFACQRWLHQSPPAVERAVLTLDRIVDDSKDAAAIVARIMEIIRRRPPASTRLDLNLIIADALRVIDDELQESAVTVHRTTRSEPLWIQADAALLQQVLVNIIRNAIDSTRERGVGSKAIFIAVHRDNGEVIVELEDDGVGFSDGAPLFDAFYTTKREGLGLGLAIARSIIESYGGHIWAQHRSPVGVIVGFRLPIASGI